MLRLLILEYSKFRKSTVIVLLTIFFLAFFPASMYILSLIPDLPNYLISSKIFYTFPSVWDYLGYAGNWMVFFFLGVLVIYSITIEVSHKTMRQSIITGMLRKEYFTSKLLVVLSISALATLYYIIIALIIGLFNTSNPDFPLVFSNEWAIPRFFLMSVSYLSFALFIGFTIRKAGVAVFFYYTFVMILEPMLRWLGHRKIDDSIRMHFYPMNATEDLMPLPLYQYADFIRNDKINFDYLLGYPVATITTLVYVGLFLGFTYYNFNKRDI